MIIDSLYFSGGCSIELKKRVILTGGVINGNDSSTVSIYGRNGWLRDLPNLQLNRRNHGCGHYVDDRSNTVSWIFKKIP